MGAAIAAVAILVLFGVARGVVVPRLSAASAATGPVERDGARTLGDCPDSPNCVGSEASDPRRRVARLELAADGAEGAIDALARRIAAEPDASIVRREADYLHATFRTRVMGYVDDVEFLAMPDGTVAVRSASRLGRSDLGANARRVERLRAAPSG